MNLRLRKLMGMSAAEIIFRLKQRLALTAERRQFFSGGFNWPETNWATKLCGTVQAPLDPNVLADWWEGHMQSRDEPPMPLAHEELHRTSALYHELFSHKLPEVEADADKVCDGQFSFLGLDTVLADPIDWHADPKSGYRWTPQFHADVDFSFCREGGSDVKYVWELSRQDYLIECAVASRLTKNQRYANRVGQLVGSWIDSNPYLEGIHWSSAIEVAVRAMNWIWAYQLCRDQKYLTPEEHLDWIKAFYQHGSYLHRHISYYYSPNNHIIAEATGLFLLGCFFPEFDESEAWRIHGWKVLEDFFAQQYYDDGGSTEQATFYHNYCLGFLILAVLVRQARDEPVPEKLKQTIERGLNFTLWMTRGDGTVPRIGDADNARAFCFGKIPLYDFRNLLAIGSIMFEREDMKFSAGKFYEDALWLFGPEGHTKFQNLIARSSQEKTASFPASGYYVMRSGWNEQDSHLAFDCGSLAAGLHTSAIPSSAHGHSDLLSFTLAIDGKPVLVDGGFYTYDEDPVWHRYFREASAHNTILVDGASHANYHPSNAWSSVAVPGPLRSHSSTLFDYCESSHAGFFGVAPPVTHRRGIFYDRDRTWLILDHLTGEGARSVEAYFHLAPSTVSPLSNRSGLLIQTESGVEVEFEVTNWPDVQVEVIEGGDGPEGGWIGTGYGFRQRAPVIRIWGEVALPRGFEFLLRHLKVTGG